MDKEPKKEEQKPEFNIEKLTKLVTLARGGDPNAQALLQELLKVEHIQEKTNFPTPVNVQKQTYLKMGEEMLASDPVFGKELSGPLRNMSKWDATNWRSYKGFNYEGNVEILRKGTDISGVLMQAQGQPQQAQVPQEKKGWFSRKPKSEELIG